MTVPAGNSSASDVPVREPGTRSRSGNAMGRTRSALLRATAECVARDGIRKTTMVDVASRSGVAKATLYNHFRTKGDVLAALVEQVVADLVGNCVATASAEGLVSALTRAAETLAGSGALRKAAEETALVAVLITPQESRAWHAAREGIAAVLTAGRAPAGPDEVDLVLRWIVSQILWPLTGELARRGAESLMRGLGGVVSVPAADGPETAVGADYRPDPVRTDAAAGPGLGWPG